MNQDDATQRWDAKLYDDKHSFVWKHGESLIDLLAPQRGESILDLGSGTGHLASQMAAAGAAVLGIDSSSEMIDEARRAYPDLCFEIADARRLAYVNQFEAVFSNAVLHWIKDAELVVQCIARALKPEGRCVAEFGGHGNVKAILAAVRNAMRALGLAAPESPWFFPSVAEYASLLERHGLEVTFATLFDRPTLLEGDFGMRQWLEMFGGPFLSRIPQDRLQEFYGRVEDELRPRLCRDGSWFADYRRLRVVAWRRTNVVE